MKGILGIIMVIAVMYPPCSQARRIPVVTRQCIAAPAEATSQTTLTPEEKAARKAADKAKKEAQKKAKKAKKKKKGANAIPEGAIATAEQFAKTLTGFPQYSTEINYDVTLPMGSDEITYILKLASAPAYRDRLSATNYLIDWRLNHDGNVSDGFLAYFNGNHYRYRDHRLQEYHYDTDSIPFVMKQGGVQSTGQFTDLIPQVLGEQITHMMTDPAFTIHFNPDTLVEADSRIALTATQTVQDNVGMRFTLIADRFNGKPVRLIREYNPGQISEQTVTAKFSYPDNLDIKAVTSEEELQTLYQEQFDKYRDNGNRIEHMRGLQMPAFSLPTTTGERYTRQKEDTFPTSTIIAIIDDALPTAAQTVKALREATGQTNSDIALILAFIGNNSDRIEEITGTPVSNETILMSAQSLARTCGTAVFPTVLVVRQSGKICNVLLGFNNNLIQDVIQSTGMIY